MPYLPSLNVISMAISRARGRRGRGRTARRYQERISLSHVAGMQFLPLNGESTDAKSTRGMDREGRGEGG